MKEIRGVLIGDVFKTGPLKHSPKAVVVDILAKKSLATGDYVGFECIAKGLGLATNEFPVPFATVVRYRISREAVND